MKPLSIGLIGQGGSNWVAGVNYCSSLVYANSLLPLSEAQQYNLFLLRGNQKKDNYKDIVKHIKSINYYDFKYGTRFAYIHLLKNQLISHFYKDKVIINNLPELLKDLKCKIVYPANEFLSNGSSEVKKISWIPDFQYKYFPKFFPNAKRIDRINNRIFKLSDIVIVSNQYSKCNAENFFRRYSHKIRVLPFTMWIGPKWYTEDYLNIIRKYNLPRKYLIYPSQFWVHKNHKYLFKAISILKEKCKLNVNLVCTGKTYDSRNPNYFESIKKNIEHSNISDNVKILGLIPRHEQIQLLRCSAGVITASLFEGWSALLDESDSLGKKVIASDIPMHREQQVKNITFFDVSNIYDLIEKLNEIWPKLNPGPEKDSEEIAIEKYYDKLKFFGMQFSEICKSII